MPRLLMSTKDVGRIIGKSRTASQKLISVIKKSVNKTRSEQITIEEFSDHMGLSLELVMKAMG